MKFTKTNLAKLTDLNAVTLRRWELAKNGRNNIYRFLVANWSEFVEFCKKDK